MTPILKKAVITTLLLICCQPALAQTAWVDDELYVPLRAGAGTGFKILHRGLKSGTQVTLLEQPQDGDWVKVRYQEIEGWIGAQYISRTPTAAIQLADLQQRHEQTRATLTRTQSDLKQLQQAHQRLTQEKTTLAQQLTDTEQALAQLQEVAADPVRLDKANRQLNEEMSLLRTELDQVKAENAMLNQDRIWRGWLYALGTIFAGLALGWFFKGRASKGRGSWV